MIVRIKPIIITLALTALAAGCQQVDFGGGCGEINGYSFSEMDGNRDGNIRLGEFKGGQIKTRQADFRVQACQPRSGSFEQVDANRDGNIVEAEFDRYGS